MLLQKNMGFDFFFFTGDKWRTGVSQKVPKTSGEWACPNVRIADRHICCAATGCDQCARQGGATEVLHASSYDSRMTKRRCISDVPDGWTFFF
jgi:hypothetical protein